MGGLRWAGAVVGGLILTGAAWAAPSTHLPPAHWAVRAAERLEELGLVHDYLPAQRSVPISEVERVLKEAANSASPQLRATAQGWLRQLHDELGRASSGLGVNASVWVVNRAAGELVASAPPLHPPPAMIAETPSSPAWAMGASAAASAWLAAGAVDLTLSDGSVHLGTWEVETELGPWSLSVGRRPVGYGYGTGMVMSASVPLTMVELSTARPVRLPWALSGLGSFAFQTFLSTLDAPRHGATSRLWGMAVQWKPHPRLVLGAQRGVMFGGDGYPGNLKEFLLMASMLKNGRENNVLSATFRYRVPAERWLPLTAYGEWATDDGDGGYLYVPGLRFGMELPSVPFVPLLSLGAEYSFIGTIAVRHFPWYAHSKERGGWVSEDLPLGHPLGGNGRELRAYASLPLFGAALGIDVSAFRRDRFYDNLYSPMRAGVSLGGNAALRWKPIRNLELSLAGEREVGAGWSDTTASGRASLVF